MANGLKKVYIGSPVNLGFNVGDPVFIYRKYTGTQGKPSYKSCITSYCIASRIEKVKSYGNALMSYDEYRRFVGNKSVYSDDELKTKYDTSNELTVIELIYYGYFGAGNNVNWAWLNSHDCWPGGHPMTCRFSREQFEKIMQEGKIDVANVIIN